MKVAGTLCYKKYLTNSLPRFCLRGSCLMLVFGSAMTFVDSASHKAQAFSVYEGEVGGDDLAIDFTTTLEYSNAERVNNPSKVFLNNVNGDEGDRDFQHGLVSNEFEATPVFNVTYGNYGMHFSGEAYLNTVYLQKNQNDSPSTYNPISSSYNSFTTATRNNNGQNAKLLDAFVYGTHYFGSGTQEQQLTLKFGRQTLLWGQSLLFASDGISAGQAPIDVQTAQTTPNALAQQVFLPVGQVVVTYQPTTDLTIQSFYQFEWQPDNFQGVGSYYSSTDLLDKGGQRLLFGPTNLGPAAYRVKDLRPPIDNGEFGAAVQYTLGNYDLGVYAERYDAKAPAIYLSAAQPAQNTSPTNVASYYLVYPRDIQLYGASASTTVGPINVGGEGSYRRNAPLVGGLGMSTTYPGSANAGALYPVGQVLNFQVSQIYVSPPLAIDPGGFSVDAEEILNSVISVDKNRAALVPGRTATAAAFQFILTPTYFFSFTPNVQWNFPVGVEECLFGRSQFDATENHGTGDFNIGVTAVYKQTWTAGIVYQDYLGSPNPNLGGDASIADRGYVGFNAEHTF